MVEGIIYRYTLTKECSEKGFCYVGNTDNEAERRRRWNNPNTKSYGGKKIQAARDKYGPNNFSYEVLETIKAPTKEELKRKLDEREAYYIQKYDSVNSGFNTSHGGTGNKGVVFSAEHRKKIGAKSKGRKHSEETKKKISKSSAGRKVSPETKAKISAGNQGKKRTEKQRKDQSERMKGKIPLQATNGAKKWVKENGGYWKNHQISESAKKHMKEAQQKRGIKVKVIDENGNETVYPTMLDVAKALGIGVGSVSYYLGSGKTNKDGYKFEKAA